MTLQDAAATKAAHRQHLLDGMAVDVFEHGVGRKLLTHLPQLCARAFMKPQRHFQLLQHAPQRLIVRIVPVARVDLVGPQKDPAEAQLLHAAARLRHGILGRKRGDHAGAQEAMGFSWQKSYSQLLYARTMAAAKRGSMAGMVKAKSPREG